MRRLASIAILLAALTAPAAFARTEMEEEYAAEVAEAEKLGRVIFEYDRAAWVATDLLVEHIGPELEGRVSGWIVEEAENARGDERVLFYRGSNGLFAPAYSIDVQNGKAIASSYRAHAENDALTPMQSAMIKARETGVKAGASGCASSYNTVVIPDASIGYLVYVLAATTDPDAIVIGGHLRHDIDAAGENVVGFRKFTNSCITLRRPPRASGQTLVALMVSQVLTPYPTEIHVWASLLHEADLFVLTGEKSMWKVSGGKISDASSILKASMTKVSFEPPASGWSVLRVHESGGLFESELIEY